MKSTENALFFRFYSQHSSKSFVVSQRPQVTTHHTAEWCNCKHNALFILYIKRPSFLIFICFYSPPFYPQDSPRMPGSFSDKVVIVTGSSQGIGRETARMFVEQGAKITITGRNEQALEVRESKFILTFSVFRKPKLFCSKLAPSRRESLSSLETFWMLPLTRGSLMRPSRSLESLIFW